MKLKEAGVSFKVISINLPPANEVWDKVMFWQVFVCPRGRGEGTRASPSRTRKAGGTHPTGMLFCFCLWTAGAHNKAFQSSRILNRNGYIPVVIHCYCSQTKFGQGNVFTRVCHSVQVGAGGGVWCHFLSGMLTCLKYGNDLALDCAIPLPRMVVRSFIQPLNGPGEPKMKMPIWALSTTLDRTN